MKNRRQKHLDRGKNAIEIIEEACHLLRCAPPSILCLNLAGTVPCLIGFLFFWTDMSGNAFAHEHCAQAALAQALLYLWMKTWQSVFVVHLHAFLEKGAPPVWTFRRIANLVLFQSIMQPWSLVILPLSAIMVLPFGYAHAFFHAFSHSGDGRIESFREVIRETHRHASRWPGQNQRLILILGLFAIAVFINAGTTLFILPYAVKTILGVESAFTRSGIWLTTPAFFIVTLIITHLCMNPIFKACQILRCFYGESIHSGADLRADLHRSRALRQNPVSAMFLLLAVLSCAPAAFGGENLPPSSTNAPLSAATPPPPGLPSSCQPGSVRPEDLTRAISETLAGREFAWRFPRQKSTVADLAEKSFLARFSMEVLRTLKSWIAPFKKGFLALRDAWDQFWDWLNKRFGEKKTSKNSREHSMDWLLSAQALSFCLLTATSCLLAVFLYRSFLKHRPSPKTAQAIVPSSTPDLKDENILATERPSDEWQSLGEELLNKGEWRLALRAFYLSSLAHLAHHQLLLIARHKTNRDYESELRRRAAATDLLEAFGDNVTLFEHIWYGMHEVDRDLVDRFNINHERIKKHA
ncbi:MAG: DUF4129 domain-containing protein [Verrucomicrobiae bacterium]|nr:DUF4129 domain-containing protein [Verrucomicrobiae bacterium]